MLMNKTDGTLHVRDSRTSREYEIPISQNTINATDIGLITLNSDDKSRMKGSGLSVFDPGLEHTVVKKTKIIGRSVPVATLALLLDTEIFYRDRSTGLPLLRGYSSQELWDNGTSFEELFWLMVYGDYPTLMERDALQYQFAEYMKEVPPVVGDVIRQFP